MQTLKLIALLITAGLLFNTSSCDTEERFITTSDISLAVDYQINGEAFTAGDEYFINGTLVRLDVVQFYLGGIKLTSTDGIETDLSSNYLLVKPGSGAQAVGTINKERYAKIDFFIGVSPEDNDQTEMDFDARAEDDPLARQEPAMHWNWNAGYRFIRIDGLVDTDGDLVPETPMEYHLGTDNFLREKTITLNEFLTENEDRIDLRLDIEELFTGIDLAQKFSMHTGDEPEIALTFADNVPTAFRKK